MRSSPGPVLGLGSSRTRIVSTPPNLSIAAANIVCSVSVMTSSSRLQPVGRSRLDVRIGGLAHATGVSASLLRYYEAQGLLSPSRTDNGYRRNDEYAATTMRQVRGLLQSWAAHRSEEHTSELQSRQYLVCRLLLDK